MSEARRQNRKRPVNYLEVYDRGNGKFMGNVIDMTNRGVRLHGERELIPDHTYTLKLVPAKFLEKREEIEFDAVCRWCNPCTGTLLKGSYGAGLEFVNLNVEVFEQIDNMINSAWFRDWHQLPDYAAIRKETGFPEK